MFQLFTLDNNVCPFLSTLIKVSRRSIGYSQQILRHCYTFGHKCVCFLSQPGISTNYHTAWYFQDK